MANPSPHLQEYYARRDRELLYPPDVRTAYWLDPTWEHARVKGMLVGMERLQPGDRFRSISGKVGVYVRPHQVSQGLHHVRFDAEDTVMGESACVLKLD